MGHAIHIGNGEVLSDYGSPAVGAESDLRRVIGHILIGGNASTKVNEFLSTGSSSLGHLVAANQ